MDYPLGADQPEVRPDRTVTFRLQAPNALKVSLGLEGSDEVSMKKGKNGTWTLTTQPLSPDIYGYAFNVDGCPTFDPLNPAIKRNLLYVSNMVTVPGTPPELWEVQDVPHGSLRHIFYKSQVIGDQRDAFIYTPPGYEDFHETLPVLYLLHGYSDTAEGWSEVGKAHVILDNLIAQRKAKPMLVVMTLGYGVPDFASRKASPPFEDKANVRKNYELFRDGLFQEVMPYVEKHYRVDGNRALAGLSMGGMETLFIGLNTPEQFHAIGAFSSGGFFDRPEKMFPNLDVAKVNKLVPFYFACGVDDGLIEPNRKLAGWLRKKEVKFQELEKPGRHAWMVWRRNLIEFASAIFQN